VEADDCASDDTCDVRPAASAEGGLAEGGGLVARRFEVVLNVLVVVVMLICWGRTCATRLMTGEQVFKKDILMIEILPVLIVKAQCT